MATPRPVVDVSTSQFYGSPIPSRLKTYVLRAGTEPTLRWTMVDARGCPQDLTIYQVGDPALVPVMLRIIENTILGFDPDFLGRCLDPAAGLIECDLDLVRIGGPGIYLAEFAVLADDLVTPILTNQFNVLVERGLFGGEPTGLPTLAEIRLRLRDAPQTNELLGDFAWDNAEIVQALQEPVDYWNGSLPDVGVYYTTQTFPHQYRYWWIKGTIAALFRIAAEHQRRNQFDYSAGGIQIQDSHRSQDYLQASELLWNDFKAWVQSRKVVLNQELGWGTENSGYRHAW